MINQKEARAIVGGLLELSYCKSYLNFLFKKKNVGIQVNSQFQQEFPSLQAAGDQEKKEKEANDENYGPGPSLRPPSEDAFYLFYLGISPHICWGWGVCV